MKYGDSVVMVCGALVGKSATPTASKPATKLITLSARLRRAARYTSRPEPMAQRLPMRVASG
jgi:hypothetical protein